MSLTRAELTVIGNREMIVHLCSEVLILLDQKCKSLTLASETEAQKNMQLLKK